MPRGRKKSPNYDNDIYDLEIKLASLKQREIIISRQLEELCDKKRMGELDLLNTIIKESKLSIDEVKRLLYSASNQAK